jgi:hypothetical protein
VVNNLKAKFFGKSIYAKQLMLSILLLFSLGQSAQSIDSALIFKNLVSDFQDQLESWELSKLDSLLQKMQSTSASAHPENSYWIAVCAFHIAQVYLWGTPDVRNEKQGRELINLAVTELQSVQEAAQFNPEAMALLGTLYGVRIAQRPWRAVIDGPRVFRLLDQAVQADSLNPRIRYLIGVSYLFTPSLLGGGIDKGLTELLHANRLFAIESTQTLAPWEPRWGYGLSLAFTGFAYIRSKQFESARFWLNKALELNSNNRMAQAALEELNHKSKGKTP